MMYLLSVCLIYAKDSDLRWFYNLAKGIALDFVTPGLSVYLIAGYICISQGTGLSIMCSSRLNLHFSGYWTECYPSFIFYLES